MLEFVYLTNTGKNGKLKWVRIDNDNDELYNKSI